MSELFNNLKMIKLYGWTDLFKGKIFGKREEWNEASARVTFWQVIVGSLWGLTWYSFPSFAFVLYILNGGTFDLILAVVGKEYMERTFHVLNWLPDQKRWLGEFYIWEEKIVKFMRIPDMQKGIQNIRTEKSKFTLELKGDFSWGFTEKKDVDIGACLTLKDMDI